MWALSLADSRSYRVTGTGITEYVRVADASLRLFGGIAILAFLIRVDVARGYLLIALPAGILMLVLERWLWRQWLVARRSIGEYSARVLLVGSEQSVAQIARELERSPSAGYRVVGACVPTGVVAGKIAGTDIPIMGNVNAVERAIAATRPTRSRSPAPTICPPRRSSRSRGRSRRAASTSCSRRASSTSRVRASTLVRWPACR